MYTLIIYFLFFTELNKICDAKPIPFVMENADDYPEYRDYLRKKFGTNLSTIGQQENQLPEYKEYIKNIEANKSNQQIIQYDQTFEFDPTENKINLPQPCKKITDDKGGYNFYCIALFVLWLMLIISALIYQLRSILILKSEIDKGSVRKSNI